MVAYHHGNLYCSFSGSTFSSHNGHHTVVVALYNHTDFKEEGRNCCNFYCIRYSDCNSHLEVFGNNPSVDLWTKVEDLLFDFDKFDDRNYFGCNEEVALWVNCINHTDSIEAHLDNIDHGHYFNLYRLDLDRILVFFADAALNTHDHSFFSFNKF